MKTLIIAFAAVTAISTTAFAAPAAKHAKHMAATHHKTTVKKAVLICPVTGNKIASIKDAVGHSTYKGKTYYFCCPECKPKFDKNPGKIVADAAKGKYEKM